MKQRGFTLIELMIVVAIIGILAAVAIPKFAEMLRKSKEGATKGSLTNLRSTLTIYISDNEGIAPMTYTPMAVIATNGPLLTGALVPKYIEAIPTAKLGTYHADTNSILRHSAYDSANKTTDVAGSDANGWVYTSTSGGGWWVSCSHTDTKNLNITSW